MRIKRSTTELTPHFEIGWNNPIFSIMNFDPFQSRNYRSNRLAFPNKESSRRHSKIGGRGGVRILDTGIFSPLLYCLSYPAIEIGGCLVGINPTVSPTGDASTHHVREPVLRTGQDQLPEYQAIWKLVVRAGVAPAMFPMWQIYSLLRSLLR